MTPSVSTSCTTTTSIKDWHAVFPCIVCTWEKARVEEEETISHFIQENSFGTELLRSAQRTLVVYSCLPVGLSIHSAGKTSIRCPMTCQHPGWVIRATRPLNSWRLPSETNTEKLNAGRFPLPFFDGRECRNEMTRRVWGWSLRAFRQDIFTVCDDGQCGTQQPWGRQDTLQRKKKK